MPLSVIRSEAAESRDLREAICALLPYCSKIVRHRFSSPQRDNVLSLSRSRHFCFPSHGIFLYLTRRAFH